MKKKTKNLELYISLVILIPFILFFLAQYFHIQYAYYDYGLFCGLAVVTIFAVYYGIIPGLMLSGVIIFAYGSVIMYQLLLGYAQTWTLNYLWFAFYPISAFLGGSIHQVELKHRDILAECESLNQKVVNIDNLTGFGNSRELLRDLDREMSRAKRYKYPLSLMVIQIQYFDELLSIYGEKGSGQLLRELSVVIDKALRIEDLRFRLEDDLFALILPHTAGEDTIVVKQRIMNGLDEITISDDSSLSRYKVEIKAGASEYRKEIPNPMAFKALALKELEYDV